MQKDKAQELNDALKNASEQIGLARGAMWEPVEQLDETEAARFRLRESPDLRLIAEATASAMQKLARAQTLVVREALG